MTSRRSKVRSRSLGQRSGQGHWVKGQGHWVRGQVKVTGSRSLGQRSGQGHWVRGQVKVTESKVKITGSKVRSRSAGDGHWNLVNTIVPAWTTEGIWTKTCRNISYIHATNFMCFQGHGFIQRSRSQKTFFKNVFSLYHRLVYTAAPEPMNSKSIL